MGFALLSPPDLQVPAGPGDVELKRLYLLHRFHGGGAGAALMEAVADAAARAGFDRLLLSVYRQINQVRLHAQWDAMKEKILTSDVIADYNRQHRGIFNALNERDAIAAQSLITEHLEKARDDLLRANSP